VSNFLAGDDPIAQPDQSVATLGGVVAMAQIVGAVEPQILGVARI